MILKLRKFTLFSRLIHARLQLKRIILI